MNQEELETYEYQLSQIKLSLAKDPSNAELLTLKTELEDLIQLTKDYLRTQAGSSGGASAAASTASPAPSSAKPSTSASSHKPAASTSANSKTSQKAFKTGDDCSCRYTDGKWYPARITSISGSADKPVYTVVYKGYDTPEVVSANDIRPPNRWDSTNAPGGGASASTTTAGAEKRKAGEMSKEELEKERKRKKNEKKAETQKAKAEVQAGKAKSWQSFAKKSAKKGVHIPGITGESMFRSPADQNPQAKVGVVGSGRGMTSVAQKKRQTFQEGGDD
ncbi:endonuclease relaxase, MobA/VirD2 family protein [Rhodotorula toruloides]|uniref:Endonuclease relaxase, MobA/VirD2 family protein n=1 Tax=Rhodotorula toruloides TaxID=5286 RepID=A0A511KEG3_RHOTO|nr:endonuclease relaxase, MobA/VirD2 family protein [Rhodotorula toruloides]